MVNKPHPPRQGNKGKKPIAAAANGEDTSFIVFAKDDEPGKKKTKAAQASNDGPTTTANGNVASATTLQETEKKPDTRTLIAGSSWTGKLPMTLLNEHAQKQKWEKVEYTVHRNAKGWTGAVILRLKNSKTQEIISLPPILPPREYLEQHGVKDSAIEARHFAAAYALYRVSNMKNIHMMLPPQYRDLWRGDFETLKTEAVAQSNGYLYEADPF